MKGQVDYPNQKNKFFLTKEDVKGSTRGRYTRKPRQPSRSKSDEKEEVLVNASPLLLPKKTSIDKPESVGVLSNDNKESITSVDDPQDQTVLSELSQPLDVEDRQAHLAQGRRLESDALQGFQARCDAITTSGETGSDAYVDCVDGFVRDINTDLPTSQTCAAACDGECCIANSQPACSGFTGKGE